MPFLGKMNGGLLNARTQQAVAARDAALYGDTLYHPQTPPTEAAARMCGAAGCTGGWLKPWKNRRRPVFEEEWGCSSRCLEALVRASVRREVGDASGTQFDQPHRHRVPPRAGAPGPGMDHASPVATCARGAEGFGPGPHRRLAGTKLRP